MIDFSKEKIFDEGIVPIKYLFERRNESDKLIISFSAFSPLGHKPVYSYVRTLKNLSVNKLFILDEYGGRGSYYLGNINNFNVEKSVALLIRYIQQSYRIDKKNICCIGSSKGGTSALYYRIKYNYGYVIAGEPQIKIGKYLDTKNGRDVLKYILEDKTGNYKDEDIKKLDKLLYDLIEIKKTIPNILIHAGNGGYHFKEHILQFINYLSDKNMKFELDIKNYDKHEDVAKYFPNILRKKLIEIYPEFSQDIYIESVNIFQYKNKITVIANAIGDLFAWYVIKDDERIYVENYKKSNCFKYEATCSGKYYIKCFVKSKSGESISASSPVITIKDE